MIVGVRIDFRLIHGQVANLWANAKQVSRFMVVDDQLATDDMQKQVLRMACPAAVKLSVLPLEKASANIQAGKYDAQRLFILAKKPETLLRLIESGVQLPEINVGNMSSLNEVKRVGLNIGMDEGDIEAFKKLQEKGIRMYAQMVPSDTPSDFTV
ncbi:PTS sugar transporter subunit IIB [Olsenella uli]|uniref:PTS sugar transporter subunit IIB n=1 Tax=Olsenella uli TaxID=133926 RepID=UPI0012ABE730|nr:PTS sugar transporter subunit IIB [Olsenella uli]